MKNFFIIAITILSLVLLNPMGTLHGKGKKGKSSVFKGRVIYLNDELVEIKRGKTELIFYFSDETKYYSSDRTEKDRSVLEICQAVRANYKKAGNRRILLKLQVIQDSYCK